ncbi:MAG: glutamate--cysteine ligase, partial [Granulosicoccus sp.]
ADLTPDDQIARRTSGYFSTMQNLLRIGWIIPYLFGASPAICASFLAEDEKDDLELWSTSTYYARYGTSLRMGKIGYRYREDQPIDLSVRHTSIDDYIEDIIAHVTTEHPPYAALGVSDEYGQRQQLSAARLQIENEFYSAVRPKQIAEHGELPIVALRERGIRYLELRSVDVNPLKPVGLDAEGVLLLEMLIIFAWLGPPAPLTETGIQAVKQNLQSVAHFGRRPGLSLEGPMGSVPLQAWGSEILDTLIPIAHWLDSGTDQQQYTQSLASYKAMIDDPSETPSAKVLNGIQSTGSFNDYTKMLSAEHHQYFSDMDADEVFMAMVDEMGLESRARQREMEEQSQGDFETFLSNYLLQVKSAVSTG